MNRLHLHVGVTDLNKAIAFYTALFGAEPVKTKDDYAKWLLDDPAVNFAISSRSGKTGLDHLGINSETPEELAEIRERLKKADMNCFGEGETVCCYSRSDKTWVEDPAGIAWEAYQNMEDAELFASVEAPAGKLAAFAMDEDEGDDLSHASCCGGDDTRPGRCCG